MTASKRYYGSSEIEFEKARKDMMVVGKRELGFYPGLCRGTIYPGFVYGSEQGARSSPVQLSSEHLQKYYGNDRLVPKVIHMYYNGGGYFAKADTYESVQVLARFLEPGICTDETNPAAAVACRVGKGTAVLIATHPEYDMDHFDENKQMEAELRQSEPDRKMFLRAVFDKMGLRVIKDASEENHVPDLTPIYLASLKADMARNIAAQLEAIAKDGIIRDSNDEVLLTRDDNDEEDRAAARRMGALTIAEDAQRPLEIRLPTTTATTGPVLPGNVKALDFDIKKYFDALQERRRCEWGGDKWYHFGNVILCSNVITSTQTVLDKNYNLAQVLPSGLTGALQFSFMIRHSLKLTHAPVVFIQYLIALAVVESIRTRKGYEDVPLRVKWPNDVYTDSEGQLKKVGGLLVNSSFMQDEFLLVVGCGINLDNARPTTSINNVIKAHNPSLARLSHEETLAGILVTFEKFYAQFCEEGMGRWFLDRYYSRWLHSDKIVTLTTHDNVQVKITGITSDYGMLEAETTDSRKIRYTLQPDGNSFDMLKGLIIKKT
ncbi:biotin-protein ligase [Dichotomocladium elegans]|nr:biotin-protein ligase [Dichotomocladium elegans]